MKFTRRPLDKKGSYDPDALSLTPVLTCVKLKKNCNSQQSEFIFPGSRSTSKENNETSEKDNFPEELATFTDVIPDVQQIILCSPSTSKSNLDTKENNTIDSTPSSTPI